jgi:hypothetical protein
MTVMTHSITEERKASYTSSSQLKASYTSSSQPDDSDDAFDYGAWSYVLQ